MIAKFLSKSLIRYIIVGVLSVGIDYGTLLVTYHVMHFGLTLATTTGFLVGLIINFILNKFWSFETGHSAKQSARQAIMVTVLVCFNLVVTDVLVVFLHRGHIGPEISKIITTGMMTLWNYVLYKKVIFKTDTDALEEPGATA